MYSNFNGTLCNYVSLKKQWRPLSDANSDASDLGLHCLPLSGSALLHFGVTVLCNNRLCHFSLILNFNKPHPKFYLKII